MGEGQQHFYLCYFYFTCDYGQNFDVVFASFDEGSLTLLINSNMVNIPGKLFFLPEWSSCICSFDNLKQKNISKSGIPLYNRNKTQYELQSYLHPRSWLLKSREFSLSSQSCYYSFQFHITQIQISAHSLSFSIPVYISLPSPTKKII